MKAISENLYERGINGMKYCRRRIPAALLAAYPKNKTHIVRSLGTTDLRLAKQCLKAEINRIDAEFALHLVELQQKQAAYARKRLDCLSEEQLKALADHWVRQVLLNDERLRSEGAGLDDEEFDELGVRLEQQRSELGRMLAMSRSDKILPAKRSGPGILNSAISGNSGHKAWPRMAWHEGVFDGQEISPPHTAHAHARVQGPGSLGGFARGQNDGRALPAV